MKSSMSKVLHPVGGLPMVAHVVRAASAAGVDAVALVVGRDADKVEAAARPFAKSVSVHVQTERLGTAHAVLAAREAIAYGYDDLLVMFGDTPLIDATALARARAKLNAGNDVVVMGFHTSKPDGYGRLVEHDHRLFAIVEERDANEDQKKITFCNGGLMALNGRKALDLLDKVENKNAKGEYYLTDIVAIARRAGLEVASLEVDSASVLGVNTRVELSEIEQYFQDRIRKQMMLEGVSMVAPETVFFFAGIQWLALKQSLSQMFFFWSGRERWFRRSDPRIFASGRGKRCGRSGDWAVCAAEAGADMRAKSKAGNFVEIKKAVIGEGAKVNHLTYIGDAEVGAKANIGAGTITCNYDGYNKFVTRIGEGAFIGSNSALVAPVSIGSNSIIAAGSVITRDVPDDALAFGRAKQEIREGRAKILHAKNKALKDAKRVK